MRFERLYLAEPFKPSEEDQKACRALWLYAQSVPADTPDNQLFRRIAKDYETTPAEMNRHWRCLEARYKCYKGAELHP